MPASSLSRDGLQGSFLHAIRCRLNGLAAAAHSAESARELVRLADRT